MNTFAGWFASWRCNCTDVELAEREIPAQCPSHGAHLLGRPELVSDLDVSVELGVEAAR